MDSTDGRTERFDIRCAPGELAMLREVADYHGLSIADLVRQLVAREYDAIRGWFKAGHHDALMYLKEATSPLSLREMQAEGVRTRSPYVGSLRTDLEGLEGKGYVRKVGTRWALTTKGESYFTPLLQRRLGAK